MASLLLRPLFRPAIGLGLGLSITTLHLNHQSAVRLDSGPVSSPNSLFSSTSYKQNARTPVLRNGKLNPSAVRQISSGSITGRHLLRKHIHSEPFVDAYDI